MTFIGQPLCPINIQEWIFLKFLPTSCRSWAPPVLHLKASFIFYFPFASNHVSLAHIDGMNFLTVYFMFELCFLLAQKSWTNMLPKILMLIKRWTDLLQKIWILQNSNSFRSLIQVYVFSELKIFYPIHLFLHGQVPLPLLSSQLGNLPSSCTTYRL